MSQPATQTDATLPSALKEVRLPCPCCGEPKACVAVNVYNVDPDGQSELFNCRDCDALFGPEEIRDLIARARRWEAVLQWINQIPQFQDE